MLGGQRVMVVRGNPLGPLPSTVMTMQAERPGSQQYKVLEERARRMLREALVPEVADERYMCFCWILC